MNRDKREDGVKKAQEAFERERERFERAKEERRSAFAEAQEHGLSLGRIGAAVGLHRTRIAQILKRY